MAEQYWGAAGGIQREMPWAPSGGGEGGDKGWMGGDGCRLGCWGMLLAGSEGQQGWAQTGRPGSATPLLQPTPFQTLFC